jgi:hypothetical protein
MMVFASIAAANRANAGFDSQEFRTICHGKNIEPNIDFNPWNNALATVLSILTAYRTKIGTLLSELSLGLMLSKLC